MARPKKNNADYFSHDSNMRSHRKILAIRTKFGLNGYAIYNMMLEYISGSDFFIAPRDEIDKEIIAGDFGVSAAEMTEIVSFCCRMNLFQIHENVIKCESLNERLQDLTSKRERERSKYSENKEDTKKEFLPISAAETPQSKVKESKVNKNKEKEDNNILERNKISDEIVSTETPEIKKPVYGDPEINLLIQKLKEHNNGIVDGTRVDQRNFGKLLLAKLKAIDKVQDGTYTRDLYLDSILNIISKNQYHSHKISGPKKMFYELAALLNICKQEFIKEKGNTMESF